jgi:hypothetical protein
VATVRIDGVEFELEDAREFFERTLIYVEAQPRMSPEVQLAVALALQIHGCLRDKVCSDVTLWEENKVVASAVLAEWIQSRGAPDAAQALHRVLTPG